MTSLRQYARQSQSSQSRRPGRSQPQSQAHEDEASDGGPGEESGQDDDDVDMNDAFGTPAGDANDASSSDPMKLAKKLVRLALSTEVTRQPLRRTEISQKILSGHPRLFKQVFAETQKILEHTFGFRLVEQPTREKVSIHQRRAAVNAGPKSGQSNSWILVSIIPQEYRTASIFSSGTDATMTEMHETAYVGLYTFITAVVALNGGTLSEPRLDRYLHRVGADSTTPVDKTDKLLQRLVKDGYLIRLKETNAAGDEAIEYALGPRAKVEIGNEGVANVVRAIYGDADSEDLERKINRSLGVLTQAGPTENGHSSQRDE